MANIEFSNPHAEIFWNSIKTTHNKQHKQQQQQNSRYTQQLYTRNEYLEAGKRDNCKTDNKHISILVYLYLQMHIYESKYTYVFEIIHMYLLLLLLCIRIQQIWDYYTNIKYICTLYTGWFLAALTYCKNIHII